MKRLLLSILIAAASLEAAAQEPAPLQSDLQYASYLVSNSRGALAYSTINSIIKSHPQCAEAYYLRAKAYMGDSNMKSASRDIDYAIKLSPSSAEYIWLKTQMLYSEDKIKEAAQHLSKVMQIDGDFAADYDDRKILAAEILALSGSAIDALPLINSVSQPSARLCRARGIAYAMAQMNSMAISELSSAMDLDPSLTDCKLWQALAKYQMGQRAEAREEWESALQRRDFRAKKFLEKYK